MLYEVITQLADYLKNAQLTPFSKTRSRAIKAQIKRMVEEIYAKQVNPQVTRVLQETATYASEVEATAFQRVFRITSYNVCYTKLLRPSH